MRHWIVTFRIGWLRCETTIVAQTADSARHELSTDLVRILKAGESFHVDLPTLKYGSTAPVERLDPRAFITGRR